METGKLKRSITLPYLVLYGLGTMIGGGFFALLGKVVGEAGFYATVALGLSGLLALLTGLSFAELASRFPVSAGEVRYISAGFGQPLLSKLTGFLVVLTGIVSAATLTVATSGFLQDLLQLPEQPVIVLLVMAMAGITIRGIDQSVGVVTLFTVIGVAALLYASCVAEGEPGQLAQRWQQFIPPVDGNIWTGIFAAAFLAFYAFIGFEDMVNLAEEIKHVRRTLPIAIVLSVILTTLVYMFVSLVALLSVPPDQLAASNTPVAEMVKGHSWYSTTGIGIVSVLMGFNSALVQVIMASRVLYGMAKRDKAPQWLATVNPRTRTPWRASLLVSTAVLLLAILFPLTTLAKVTSGIILLIFAVVNLALWHIKRSNPDLDSDEIRIPDGLPLLAGLTCVFALAFQLWILLIG